MGITIYIVNHTLKKYIFTGCKMSELYANRKIMCGIIYILKNSWNNSKIEFLGCDQIDKISGKGYKERKVNWEDFNDF